MHEEQKSSTKTESHSSDWKNIFIGILIGGVLVGLGLSGYYHYQVKSEKIRPTRLSPDEIVFINKYKD